MQNNPNLLPDGTRSDYDNKQIHDKIFVFELIKRNPDAALMKDSSTNKVVAYPISFPIPLVGSVLMKRKSDGIIAPRRIRVADGEPSIFLDERVADGKFKEKLVLKNFINGRVHVKGTDAIVLEFLMTSDMCENKPGRDVGKAAFYRLVDNSIIANKAMEADRLEFDVVRWCQTGDWEKEVKPLARIIYKDSKGMLQKPEDIRYDLTRVAKSNVSAFKDMLDDPKTKRKMVIFVALDKGLLEVDTSDNTFYWKNHKANPITQAAPGLDVIDDFILKSFSGNGEIVYNTIYDRVYPSEVAESIPLAPEAEEVVPEIVKADPSLAGPTDTTDEILSLVITGIEKGFITGNKNSWLKYKENKSQMKAEGMVRYLRDNETILKLLKRDLLVE